ncbi:hypothetical protein EQ500_11755 [Lactobacillus sp. XV13L]|nr:hypothetical protein [Lactobacillus sp. XV13L]
MTVSDTNKAVGRFGVRFYNQIFPGTPSTDKSATFQINPNVLDPLKDYFNTRPASKTSPSTTYQHLNLIFPLQWTASINHSSPTL